MPRRVTLTGATGRLWTLSATRALGDGVEAVEDADGAVYALKSVHAPDSRGVDRLLEEGCAWRRGICPNVVRLVDVGKGGPGVMYLMELCDVVADVGSVARALRVVAAVAAGVEGVIRGGEKAHGNIGGVLYVKDGVVKLGGFGATRAARARGKRLSERDDVAALAALLYDMVYGSPFSIDAGVVPNARVQPPVAALLRSVLCVRPKERPDLTTFRYELAAARRLVPVCTPALPPLARVPRENILNADLNSVRGGGDALPPRVVPVGKPYASPPVGNAYASPSAGKAYVSPSAGKAYVSPSAGKAYVSPSVGKAYVSPSAGKAYAPPPVEKTYASPPVGKAPPSLPTGKAYVSPSHVPVVDGIDVDEGSAELDIESAVRMLTDSDLSAPRPSDAAWLNKAVDVSQQSSQDLLKVMFKRPISKNPLVAFKSVLLLHHVLAEGPLAFCDVVRSQNGFLSWIESSWSRERIQSKPAAKAHMYAYCFATGDISWYAAMLRLRVDFHTQYAALFSSQWSARVDGLPSVATNRRNVLRAILGIVEKASIVLKRAATCRDPTVAIKTAAVPVLVGEVARAYRAACWIYATAAPEQKLQLQQEFDLTHHAARGALKTVRANPDLATQCAPNTLLILNEEVPRNFDAPPAVDTGKRKKKKAKERKSRAIGVAVEDGLNGRPVSENANSDTDAMSSDEGGDEQSQVSVSEKTRKKKTSKKLKKSKTKKPTGGTLSDALSGRESNSEEEASDVTLVSGRSNGIKIANWSADENKHKERSKTSAAVGENGSSLAAANGKVLREPSPPGTRRTGKRLPPVRQRYDEGDYSDSVSDASSSGDDRGRNRTGTRNEGRKVSKGKRKNKSTLEARRNESETEAARAPPPGSHLRSGIKESAPRRKGSDSETSAASDTPGSDESGGEGGRRSKRPARKVKKAHVNEKDIPFDKNLPVSRKKKSAKPSSVPAAQVSDERPEGSREALAAAASGRKTPVINPRFEVAPHEVQFGPQIGSGGFGIVFKAKFQGETVAIKKIHAHALNNTASIAEFQSEVAVLCTLRHPNILRFMGACTKPPNLMIITEFMARGTLFDVLHQSQMRVTWPMRRKFALDTCRGMRYLHDSKLLHRDLKSSNMMLDKDFNCKVGDFGLTRISAGAVAAQMTGQCGTFQYMAVEVLANKPYSEKADVFSFGILLWEMVARRLPYFGMQPMQVGLAVVQQGLRPTIPPKCPAPLAKLMRICWDSDPVRRPSFAQLVKTLEAMPE